jgi:peptidoglycan/xylan/chitin deacetylase (PgdA/CDA1 family)
MRLRTYRFCVAFAIVALVFPFSLELLAARTIPPLLVLAPGGNSIKPVDSGWREVSDWLMGRKYAVLTFDDGPYGHGVDEHIIGILRKHHAHAVFFLVCSHITDSTEPVLDELKKNGDLIGNHSFDHLKLTYLQEADLRHEIDGCSQLLAKLSGRRPYYFRPPFGMTSPLVTQSVHAAGMKQMLWNANSEDSWMTKPEQILYWSLEETDNHSILLLHDKPATAAVLDQVLTQLEQRGFQFVLPDHPPFK